MTAIQAGHWLHFFRRRFTMLLDPPTLRKLASRCARINTSA